MRLSLNFILLILCSLLVFLLCMGFVINGEQNIPRRFMYRVIANLESAEYSLTLSTNDIKINYKFHN
jgi:hypothetical protein